MLPKIDAPLAELILPSNGKKIRYRPFLSKEEKILLMALESKDPNDANLAIVQVLNNCLQTEGIDIEKLPIFDIEYFFLNLRAASVGSTVKIVFKGNSESDCDDCKKSKVIDIDLTKVQVVKNPEHTNKIKLSDNLTIILKYPTLGQITEYRNIDKKAAEIIFEVVADSVDQIYDSVGDKTYDVKDYTREELLSFLENLTVAQFQEIEKFFSTMPKVTYEVNLDCKNKKCKFKHTHKLEGLQSFFG